MKIKIKRSLLQSCIFQALNEVKKDLKLTQFVMLYLLLKPGVGSTQLRTAMVEYSDDAQPKSYTDVTSHTSYFGSQGAMNRFIQKVPDGRYVLNMNGRKIIKDKNLLSKVDIVKPYIR